MAVGTILLFPGGYGGDGTAGSISATPVLQVSTGAASGNIPKLFRMSLKFDSATDWHWYGNFKLPQNYNGTQAATYPLVRGSFSTDIAGGGTNIQMKFGLCKASGANNDDVYIAADVSGAVATHATAQTEQEFTIQTVTATSYAAGDTIAWFIGRDADSGTDSATTANLYLYNLAFEYTTT